MVADPREVANGDIQLVLAMVDSQATATVKLPVYAFPKSMKGE
jgi:hypothetical protein